MRKLVSLLVVSAVATSAAFAQKAFKQLGISLEAGTTGAGVNISYPLVTDHLIFSVGYNFPSFTYKTDFDINSNQINEKINSANGMINRYNKVITDYPEEASKRGLSKIETIETLENIKADIDAKINFGNFKAMIEYYPTTKSNFHFTAGVLIGNAEWMNISAQADQKAWSTYLKAIEQNNKVVPMDANSIAPGYPDTDVAPVRDLDKSAKFNINGQTFLLDKDSKGHMDAKLTVNKVKPYLGIGFGNSIPEKHRCGFQMEIGAYYQGKATIESINEVSYDPSAYSAKSVDDFFNTVQKFSWYPQLTFRLTGRIF